jgi:hypothetical protein
MKRPKTMRQILWELDRYERSGVKSVAEGHLARSTRTEISPMFPRVVRLPGASVKASQDSRKT